VPSSESRILLYPFIVRKRVAGAVIVACVDKRRADKNEVWKEEETKKK